MNLFSDSEIVIINGKPIKKIYGGFGDNQPCILAKQVADLHGQGLKEINRIVNNNLEWFDDGIDIINLKSVVISNHHGHMFNFLMEFYNQEGLNRSEYIYMFSQQGYALLIKFLKTDLAKQIYKQMVREYFGMKAAAKNAEFSGHGAYKVQSLTHIAEEDAALERMFRKRKKFFTALDYDKSEAILSALSSIRKHTGIDLSERLGFDIAELKVRLFGNPEGLELFLNKIHLFFTGKCHIPKSGAHSDDIVDEILLPVSEGMIQNIVAFHSSNGVFNKYSSDSEDKKMSNSIISAG